MNFAVNRTNLMKAGLGILILIVIFEIGYIFNIEPIFDIFRGIGMLLLCGVFLTGGLGLILILPIIWVILVLIGSLRIGDSKKPSIPPAP